MIMARDDQDGEAREASADELLAEAERRSAGASPTPLDAEAAELNVVRELLLDPASDPEIGRDATLGGYIAKHDRPPAFEGADAQPYTVGMETEETDDLARPYVGFLVFVRWAATGAGIMGHLETGDLSHGASEEDAVRGLLDLTLYDIKEELDAAIERHRSRFEEE